LCDPFNVGGLPCYIGVDDGDIGCDLGKVECQNGYYIYDWLVCGVKVLEDKEHI
jgi:hypothetical protein